jgi:hypothetical protein
VQQAGDTDEHDQERAEQQAHRHGPDREAEERRAHRREQAGEEEPARDDILRAGTVPDGERGRRRRAPGADAEGRDARDRVAVVGDDPPEDGVVAVRQPILKRHDERAPAGDARLSGEHGAAAVPHGLDPRSGADVVVEDDAHGRRRRRQHRLVGRHDPNERRVRPGRRRERETAENKDEEAASAQRLDKASDLAPARNPHTLRGGCPAETCRVPSLG